MRTTLFVLSALLGASNTLRIDEAIYDSYSLDSHVNFLAELDANLDAKEDAWLDGETKHLN